MDERIYCTQCGKSILRTARFCPACGKPQTLSHAAKQESPPQIPVFSGQQPTGASRPMYPQRPPYPQPAFSQPPVRLRRKGWHKILSDYILPLDLCLMISHAILIFPSPPITEQPDGSQYSQFPMLAYVHLFTAVAWLAASGLAFLATTELKEFRKQGITFLYSLFACHALIPVISSFVNAFFFPDDYWKAFVSLIVYPVFYGALLLPNVIYFEKRKHLFYQPPPKQKSRSRSTQFH